MAAAARRAAQATAGRPLRVRRAPPARCAGRLPWCIRVVVPTHCDAYASAMATFAVDPLPEAERAQRMALPGAPAAAERLFEQLLAIVDQYRAAVAAPAAAPPPPPPSAVDAPYGATPAPSYVVPAHTPHDGANSSGAEDYERPLGRSSAAYSEAAVGAAHGPQVLPPAPPASQPQVDHSGAHPDMAGAWSPHKSRKPARPRRFGALPDDPVVRAGALAAPK